MVKHPRKWMCQAFYAVTVHLWHSWMSDNKFGANIVLKYQTSLREKWAQNVFVEKIICETSTVGKDTGLYRLLGQLSTIWVCWEAPKWAGSLNSGRIFVSPRKLWKRKLTTNNKTKSSRWGDSVNTSWAWGVGVARGRNIIYCFEKESTLIQKQSWVKEQELPLGYFLWVLVELKASPKFHKKCSIRCRKILFTFSALLLI